jgi:hypothetical protein
VFRMGSQVKSAALPLLVLLFLLLMAGCISIGPPPPPGTGRRPTPTPTGTRIGGFPGTTLGNVPRVSLPDALAALTAAGQEGRIDTRGMTLRQVYGYGVDSSGLARSWVLGMEKDGKTTLLAYREGEWKALEMDVDLPEGEVKIGETIPPEDLFRENLNAIVTEMNRRRVGECDLTLNGTTYQVTIRSATDSSTLSFNAKAGEVTALHTPAQSTPVAGIPSPATPGRLDLPLLVPLGAAALVILGSRPEW